MKKQTINKKYKIPTVYLGKNFEVSQSGYSTNGKRWSASTLINYCKEKKYPIFDLPLCGLDLSAIPWDIKNIDDFLKVMAELEKQYNNKFKGGFNE